VKVSLAPLPSEMPLASHLRKIAVAGSGLAFLLGNACARVSASRSSASASGASSAERFDFALIGDQQYRASTEPDFVRLMRAIDTASVEFVVHVGDFKAGATPCTDSLFESRRNQFSRSAHPFVFLYGDNEWSDCYMPPFESLERLTRLRELFSAGDRSLGRTTMALERETVTPEFAAYRENVRWERGPVMFVGLNVPGTSQGYRRNEAEERAYQERTRANVAWLEDSFRRATARGLRGVMVLMQANPMFDRSLLSEAAKQRFAEHDPIISALERNTRAFGRPVVLVHGDYHYFEIDMPMRDSTTHQVLKNFTRVQVFGDPNAHWVRGTVDPSDPSVFRFVPVIVP
jgi:hypothetical protein